jgi:hypothetical protein
MEGEGGGGWPCSLSKRAPRRERFGRFQKILKIPLLFFCFSRTKIHFFPSFLPLPGIGILQGKDALSPSIAAHPGSPPREEELYWDGCLHHVDPAAV